MVKGNLRLTLPNPHQGEISNDLLSRILKQAGISHSEWSEWEKLCDCWAPPHAFMAVLGVAL